MNEQLTTNKFKRDKHSKALISKDVGGLKKRKAEKERIQTINDQSLYINTLEERIKRLEDVLQEVVDSKKLVEN